MMSPHPLAPHVYILGGFNVTIPANFNNKSNSSQRCHGIKARIYPMMILNLVSLLGDLHGGWILAMIIYLFPSPIAGTQTDDAGRNVSVIPSYWEEFHTMCGSFHIWKPLAICEILLCHVVWLKNNRHALWFLIDWVRLNIYETLYGLYKNAPVKYHN